ncbi:MAG: hypothetical protein FWE31_06060 [Firmicutes bacterium]|nr:hypothetical protein [Bacillota bacterium]
MLRLDKPLSTATEVQEDSGKLASENPHKEISSPSILSVQKSAGQGQSLCSESQRSISPRSPVANSSATLTLWGRVKRLKNKEVYIAAIVVLVMIAVYASNFMGGSERSPSVGDNAHIAPIGGFAREMEQRLVQTLSNVAGAGRVSAMVTVSSTPSREIAFVVTENTVTQAGPNGTTNTTTTITKTPVMVGGQPFVVYERKPQILGVIIVASGASDVQVRFALLRAAQALIPDRTVRIEILA